MRKGVLSKTVCVGFAVLAIVLASATAGTNLSVPVTSRVYRIIDAAQTRQLIENQIQVRPYPASKVLALLQEILAQKEKLTDSEIAEVESYIAEIERSYGKDEQGVENLSTNGFIRTYDEEHDISASIGVELSSSQTVGFGTDSYDSRNSALVFMKADLGEHISLNMNLGLLVDHLDPSLYLDTEFTISAEGYYRNVLDSFSKVTEIPSDGFYTGTNMFPELAFSYFDGALTMRWGSIYRDWGPGLDNLFISASARTMDGVEAQVEITDWLRYSVMDASLGVFWLDSLDGEDFYSDQFDDKASYVFDNNLSSHRVEIDITDNLTLGVSESVVWEKRFELGYINPLSIYMIEQNLLGDVDDVIAGFDFTYTLPGKARFYGAAAATEFHDLGSLSTMLTAPRNIMAFQAGVSVPLSVDWFSFSTVTFQWTYLSPFFYSHYPTMEEAANLSTSTVEVEIEEDEDGESSTYTVTTGSSTTTERGNTFSVSADETVTVNDEEVTFDDDGVWYSSDGRLMVEEEEDGSYSLYETSAETAYVNKGEAMGYPLNPNSMEFLLQLDAGMANGWSTTSSLKYQVRSGQYGYEIEQYMFYSSYKDYEDKDFWGNTFEHDLTLEVEISKQFDPKPIEWSAGFRVTATWEREIDGAVASDGTHDDEYGEWESVTFSNALTMGIKIYY
jgi:hypothetical protein